MPKVSICVPSYNQPEKIARCLRSIRSQSYKDYEVIITDDTPDDKIRSVVSSFSDLNIIFHKNPEPLGPPANWNKAISMAKGNYVKLMHHDDWFAHEHSLQGYVNLLDNDPSAVFAFSSCANWSDDSTLRNTHILSDKKMAYLKKDPTLLFKENVVGSPSVTIFRSSFSQMYDNNLKWLVDIDLYISCLLQNSGRFTFTKDVLANVDASELNRVTSSCYGNPDVELKENIYVFEKLQSEGQNTSSVILGMWNILYRFKIKNISEFAKYNLSADKKYHRKYSLICTSAKIYRTIESILTPVLKALSPLMWLRLFTKFLTILMLKLV